MKWRETLSEKTLRQVKQRKRGKICDAVIGCCFVAVILAYTGFMAFCFLNKKANPKGQDSAVSSAPLPRNLTINGESWLLQPYDFKGNGWRNTGGVTGCDKQIIWYDFSDESAQYQRTILWHEITHAAHCKGYDQKLTWWGPFAVGSTEHPEVYKLGMFLPGFVHDNPEFMKWAEDWK